MASINKNKNHLKNLGHLEAMAVEYANMITYRKSRIPDEKYTT